MNQEFKMSQKLKKWRKWMKVIEKEICSLVADANIFWEVQDIIRENPSIQKPSSFYRYLARTYLSHALAGLRRQIKPHKDSISFVGLLNEIIENPKELSLDYYCSLWSESGAPQQLARSGLDYQQVIQTEFEQYADASGAYMCPQKVVADREKLKSTLAKHEAFADKRIAHWDKDEPEVVPTFGELDDCIKLLDKTYVKYHLLFYAEGMDTLMPTYQYQWKAIFLEPWIKTGFGSAKGLFTVGEDFDDELPEFKEYME